MPSFKWFIENSIGYSKLAMLDVKGRHMIFNESLGTWTDGAWFSNAAYPYLGTYTCPGHATVSTGAFPHLHGIMQNTWWDRTKRRMVACTDDDAVTTLQYPGGTEPGASAARLLLPTFADQLRAERADTRVATVALKARSAIMLAGHGGGAVTWMDETYDHWETSTAFTAQRVPAVQALLAANPVDADFGRTWDRRLPPERYTTPDDGDSESPPRGWTAAFPHVLNIDHDQAPDRDFRGQWARSPFADAYVGRFAASLAECASVFCHSYCRRRLLIDFFL